MRINDVKALISGGASGLGFATAERLVAGGARVTMLDVNEEAGARAARALGEAARFEAVDVTNERAVDAAVEQASKAMGGLNLIGTLLVSKAASAAMSKNAPNAEGERGLIVMTASVAAFDGQIGQVAYSASKGGIVGMTLPMARDLASSGIRVMTIAPGIFKTPLMASLPQEAQDSLGQQVPFPPRLGRPEEYAALVAHVCENVMLNGECIRLDGAIRMAPK
jgi:NAD(P)-dependent dehydrogenase (short-subunit alcohol dehydrogenase family)